MMKIPVDLIFEDGFYKVKPKNDEKFPNNYGKITLSKTNRITAHWWRIGP